MNILDEILEKGENVQPQLLDVLALAFLGDAIHSLYVRNSLVLAKDYKQKDLQGIMAEIVCAKNQARTFDAIKSELNETEGSVVRRARNAKTNNIAKNSTAQEYKKSTAFEALLAYEYLTKNAKRLSELLELATTIANKKEK